MYSTMYISIHNYINPQATTGIYEGLGGDKPFLVQYALGEMGPSGGGGGEGGRGSAGRDVPYVNEQSNLMFNLLVFGAPKAS